MQHWLCGTVFAVLCGTETVALSMQHEHTASSIDVVNAYTFKKVKEKKQMNI